MKKLSTFEVVTCLLGMVMAFTVGMVALCTGHDGLIVTAVCTAIGAMVGYLVRGGSTPRPAPAAQDPPLCKPFPPKHDTSSPSGGHPLYAWARRFTRSVPRAWR